MVAENQKLTIPAYVMARKVGAELVILNLNNEQYYGLDEVGASMWEALTNSDSLKAALDTVQAEYDVAADELRSDLHEILDKLIAEGLLEVAS